MDGAGSAALAPVRAQDDTPGAGPPACSHSSRPAVRVVSRHLLGGAVVTVPPGGGEGPRTPVELCVSRDRQQLTMMTSLPVQMLAP